ncbi:OmpA family protein [Cytobacillus sp. S13-E01]|uniref:OmpA family protein n=1 Tax=Cytobacillus sp. S13-E01 TaxID=3031326 RepID=UPI0023D8A030|nr:OmpA family protein [Cytobacillus sp. S13-E01]MDF0728428.1 OmpA family protein [Cytobacillus sp. S13-E01]
MSRRNFRIPTVSKQTEETGSHWMSFTDLMSGLLLIFALFLMVNLFDHQTSMEKKDELIEEVVGIKTEIIEELRKAFSHSNLRMDIDPKTGVIRFSSGVFFGYNSYEVTPAGGESLREFIPEYIGILLSEQFRDHISQIIVEGHTDQEGSYLYNLDLSQTRSFAVVKEILSEDFPDFEHKNEMRSLLTSNGRSFSEPMLNEEGKIDPEKSRRVEFKFRLKDEQVFEEIQKLVNPNE